MFDVILPVTIGDSNLVSCTIAEDDHAEYDAGTTYGIGNRVIVSSVHAIFESVATGNLGHDPVTDDGTNWVIISATNRWKAFDKQIQTPASATDTVTYVLTSDELVTSVCLFGLTGAEAVLTIENGVDSFTYTRNLRARPGVVDYFTWFFGPIGQKTTVLFSGLPNLGPGTTFTITVNSPSSSVGIGQIVLGYPRNIGRTRWDTEVSIISGSRKDRDIYLNFTIVKRATARRLKFNVLVLRRSALEIMDMMRALDAEPAVWIGDVDEDYGLISYGLFFDYVHQINLPDKTEFTVIIEELK